MRTPPLRRRVTAPDRRIEPRQGLDLPFDSSDATHVGVPNFHVWVTNYGGNSVTELSAKTGALVQVISGSSYGFNEPLAISSDGTDVWVMNGGNNSVTELSASTGSRVQVLSGSNYGFNGPVGITSDGSDVWVPNYDGQSVTVFPT